MVGYAKDGRYFRYGGEVYNYMANWRGLPPPANGHGGRTLGSLGPFGLSTNEQRLFTVGAVALVGVVLWSRRKGRRR